MSKISLNNMIMQAFLDEFNQASDNQQVLLEDSSNVLLFESFVPSRQE